MISEPPGALLLLGKDKTPVGHAPATVAIPISSEAIELVARFSDGTEVVEMIVPDQPRPQLVFTKPSAPVATSVHAVTKHAATTTAVKKAAGSAAPEDRDGTLDPFKQ